VRYWPISLSIDREAFSASESIVRLSMLLMKEGGWPLRLRTNCELLESEAVRPVRHGKSLEIRNRTKVE
jgi:hypothetical protein